MLMLISPAKSLDFETPSRSKKYTQPQFLQQSEYLIRLARKLTPAKLSKLMGISDKLAALNTARFEQWQRPFTFDNSKQAIFTFTGDVYLGLDANTLKANQIDYLQQHLAILSGLYGVLKPLDLMQPYRLEMGTKFPNKRGSNLYHYWRALVTHTINQALQLNSNQALINLSSNEYFSVIDKSDIEGEIITPVFKDWKNGNYKMISFFAKKARGMMARYAAIHQINDPQKLKDFNMDGYHFDQKLSTDIQWVFTRKI